MHFNGRNPALLISFKAWQMLLHLAEIRWPLDPPATSPGLSPPPAMSQSIPVPFHDFVRLVSFLFPSSGRCLLRCHHPHAILALLSFYSDLLISLGENFLKIIIS